MTRSQELEDEEMEQIEIPRRRASDQTFWDRHSKGIRATIIISVPACVVSIIGLTFWAGQQSQVLANLVIDSATHSRLLEERRAVEAEVAILKAQTDTRSKARDEQIADLKEKVGAINLRMDQLEQRMYDRVRGGA